jgi:hypothetical protein
VISEKTEPARTKMTKMRFVVDCVHYRNKYKAGRELEFPEEEVVKLLDRRVAVRSSEPKK